MEQLSLSIFNGFTMAGIIVGLGLSIFVGRSPYAFRGRWILFWLLTITLHQLYFFLNLNGIIPGSSLFSLLGFPLAMLHMPFFYLNIRELMVRESIGWRRLTLHLLPYSSYGLYLIYLYFSSDGEAVVVRGFLDVPVDASPVIKAWNGIPMALSGVFYVGWSILKLLQYRKAMPTFYTNFEGVDLAWIQRLIELMGVLFVTIFLLIILGRSFRLFEIQYVFRFVSLVLTFFTAYYAYRYIKQIEIFHLRKETALNLAATEVNAKYVNSSLTLEEMENIQTALLKVLEEEDAYLDEELTLAKLATQLAVSSQKVSETLNRSMQQSFYDVVNAYRIERAKSLLLDPAYHHLSIEGIAYECGFKSRSTFFKFFKKVVGSTPTAFKKAAQASKPD